MREPPLRRAFGVELAAGIATLVLGSAALWLAHDADRKSALEAASEASHEPDPAAPAAPPGPEPVEPAAREPVESEPPPAFGIPFDDPAPEAFAVDVVDEDGRPLPRVALALLVSNDAGASAPRAVECWTDNRGRARFELAELAPPRDPFTWRADAPPTAPGRARVTTSPELERAPSLALPGSVEGGDVFRLVLPARIARAFAPLRVRVVDAAGAPVSGALVRWIAANPSSPPERMPSATARSDDSGLAVLPLDASHLRAWQARLGGANPRYWIELVVPPQSPRLELEGDLAPQDELTLVLPPVGTLSVRVEGRAGEPVREGATVRVFGWRADSAVVDDEELGQAHVEDGTATFALIGLGLELRVEVTRDDGVLRPGRVELAGPRAAGERVEAVVVLGRAQPTLRVRLVDEDAKPLAGEEVLVGFDWRIHYFTQVTGTSDARGELRLPLLLPSPDERLKSISLRTRHEGQVRRELSLDLSELAPENGLDLGTRVLPLRK